MQTFAVLRRDLVAAHRHAIEPGRRAGMTCRRPRYSYLLLSRARETCSGRLVGAAVAGGTMVMSPAGAIAISF